MNYTRIYLFDFSNFSTADRGRGSKRVVKTVDPMTGQHVTHVRTLKTSVSPAVMMGSQSTTGTIIVATPAAAVIGTTSLCACALPHAAVRAAAT